MTRLLIIARERKAQAGLCEGLARNGLACSTTSYNNGVREAIAVQRPDIVLVEIDRQLPDLETWDLINKAKNKNHVQVIALVPENMLDNIDSRLDVDDFLTGPFDPRELSLRISRLLQRRTNRDSNELLTCDGLVLDLATCEVTVDGRVVELTFKEYELLKLMAGNRGRVYTREALLDKIWGYDYYGGDRTVDVHIRRLRSKIEDSKHTFIETVRNIGYRFRKEM